jgi:hypothetical protein
VYRGTAPGLVRNSPINRRVRQRRGSAGQVMPNANLTIGGNEGWYGETAMTSLPPAGWYPNPSGAPGQRYFDGRGWTAHHRSSPPTSMPVAPQPMYPPIPRHPVPMPTTVVVTGPNHALHAVLTLLTFWACGGWAWIWLIVALSNRRRVHVITGPPQPPR